MLRNVEGSDFSVQGTNDEAQVSKLSCATLGYYKDDFIKYFVRKHTRRSPLINRGYFSRYSAITKLLREFLKATEEAGLQAQVLCLGAGFDTRWFQMLSDNGRPMYKCLEVDFIEVTQRKAAIIQKEPVLHSLLEKSVAGHHDVDDSNSTAPPPSSALTIDVHHGEITSPFYTLTAVDLRKPSKLDEALAKASFDTEMPTFILSECVLVYLEAAHAAAVLEHLAAKFSRAAAVAIYEQVKPDDAFGRQMVLNLELRGCPLRSLAAVPTLEAHSQRLLSCGWSRADSRDMDELYRRFVDPAEQARAERIEIFDEFEEWHLIQEHYCITLGVNDREGLLSGLGFNLRAGVGDADGPSAAVPFGSGSGWAGRSGSPPPPFPGGRTLDPGSPPPPFPGGRSLDPGSPPPPFRRPLRGAGEAPLPSLSAPSSEAGTSMPPPRPRVPLSAMFLRPPSPPKQ